MINSYDKPKLKNSDKVFYIPSLCGNEKALWEEYPWYASLQTGNRPYIIGYVVLEPFLLSQVLGIFGCVYLIYKLIEYSLKELG